MATTYRPATYRFTVPWWPDEVRYDNVTSRSEHEPNRVSGKIIHWPNGSVFRRATTYGRSVLQLKPTSPLKGSLGYNGIHTSHFESSPGGWFYPNNITSPNWAYAFSDLGIGSINHPPDFETQERNEAVTKSLNMLADQKANIGENLATLGQTVRMFANPAKYLISGLKRIHNDKSLRPFLRNSYRDLVRGGIDRKIAGKYLEYVYGLAPLMQDIYSVATLAKEQANAPLMLSARKSARRDLVASEKMYDNFSSWMLEYFEQMNGKSRTSCSLYAKLSENYSGTRTLNQLGLTNPASLIWELVPYSFCVDWFLPVGPVLQALTAPAGLDFVNGSVARRVSMAWTARVEQKPDYRDWVKHDSVGKQDCIYEGYNRYELTEWPRGGLWFDPDPFRLKSDGSDRKFKALALAIVSLPRF